MNDIGIFMRALSREGDYPKVENLRPVLHSIGIVSHDDALRLIGLVRSADGSRVLKVAADDIHSSITGSFTDEEVSAIIANAIAVVADLPDWKIIPSARKHPQPRIT